MLLVLQLLNVNGRLIISIGDFEVDLILSRPGVLLDDGVKSTMATHEEPESWILVGMSEQSSDEELWLKQELA
jgi:hypothetical protein